MTRVIKKPHTVTLRTSPKRKTQAHQTITTPTKREKETLAMRIAQRTLTKTLTSDKKL
jgi:hypothetical protein